MKNSRLVVGMALAMAILFAWQPIWFWVGKRLGYDVTQRPAPTEQVVNVEPSTAPATNPLAVTTAPATGTTPAAAGAADATAPPAPVIQVAAPATEPVPQVTLGSNKQDDPSFHMEIATVAQGAGIDSVTLNEFKHTARSADHYTFQKPYPNVEAYTRPFATRTITLNGTDIDLSTSEWTLESSTPDRAVFTTTLNGPNGPAARLKKTFALSKPSDPSKGYEVLITQSIENAADAPLVAKLTFNGPTMPETESYRGGDRQIMAGYALKGTVEVTHDMLESFAKEHVVREYLKDSDGNPMLWMGSASSYFQAIVYPEPIGGQTVGPVNYLERVVAQVVNPDAKPTEREITTTFVTTPLNVAPHTSVSLPFRVFIGPRQRNILNDPYYANYPLSYNSTLVVTSGLCAICTFQWLIDILVALLRAFHFVWRDWGMAIITLVVLVRVLLHPLTKRSQISMARMSKMAPEMERLKKKYGDDKEGLTKAMWELQKEQGIGQYLGCLPMFLQMPIWIALWQSLQTTFELRQAPFLWGFTWIHDLSKPDHLIEFANPINISFLPTISGLNVLPFLLGLVFFFQMKYQQPPRTGAMTKEQEQQQKMMQLMMPFIFPIMLYSGPSGLNLYILTSTFIGIIESKVVRKHLAEREAAEKEGRVIVDAGRKFKSGPPTGTVRRVEPEQPKSGLAGWLASMQAKMDDIRRDADKRGK